MDLRIVAVAALVTLAMSLAAVPAAAQTDCSFPYTTTDGGGTEVTVQQEPRRVVTLNPSAAQTMWEIGAHEKVVGLSKYAAYLEGAESRTNVSGAEQIVVLEKVVALEPDLVLAPNTIPPETVDKLRQAGVTVYHFPPALSIDDVERMVVTTGQLTGECEGATETVAWMRERLAIVDEAVAGGDRPSALYLFFGYTAGEGTFVDEVIERAGGTNLAADIGVTGYRQLSEEVVVDQDPDWIVLNSEDPALPESAAVRGTTAAQRNQTVVVQIEHINQPAPRVIYAIETLAASFHPEAYAAANATPSPSPTDEEVTTVRDSTAEPEDVHVTRTRQETATPGQSGLGAVAALVAVGLALAARMRLG